MILTCFYVNSHLIGFSRSYSLCHLLMLVAGKKAHKNEDLRDMQDKQSGYLPNLFCMFRFILHPVVLYPLLPINSIWAELIVWRITEKIIRSVLCCVVWHNYCAHSNARWYEQFLEMTCFRFKLLNVFLCFNWGHFICLRVIFCFMYFLFVVVVWLSVPLQSIAWNDSPLKWSTVCWVGCSTLTTHWPPLVLYPIQWTSSEQCWLCEG